MVANELSTSPKKRAIKKGQGINPVLLIKNGELGMSLHAILCRCLKELPCNCVNNCPKLWLAPSFTHPPVVQERPMHWNLYLVTTIPLKGFPTGQGVDFVLGEGKTFPPNYPKNHQHPVSPCTYPIFLR